MKVLWFTNTFVPGKEQSETATLRGSGSWMVALYEALLRERPDLSLAIATARPARSSEAYRVGNVDCFVVPMQKEKQGRVEARALQACAAIVQQWRPDVVHIHGTERFFGLLSARRMISPPTVISLQGLLGPYSRWQNYFGNRSLWQIARMHRLIEPFVMRGLLWEFLRWRRNARREREILLGNQHFMGRTSWDRAQLASVNPTATYYHVGEILREPFWHTRWKLRDCARYRIIVANVGHPRKGVETVLMATDLLAQEYPHLEVAVAGPISSRNGFGRHLRREFAKRGSRVRELGPLNAREVSSELRNAHVFVSSSFIDNSPNAVCEAQLVGVPVIASYVGGVPSLVKEGETGLVFPPGDAPCLAARLREVFCGDDLSEHLSIRANEAASKRHDPTMVVHQLLAAYEGALAQIGSMGRVRISE